MHRRRRARARCACLLSGVALAAFVASFPREAATKPAYFIQASLLSQSYQIRDAAGHALSLSRLDTYLRLFALDLLPTSGDRREDARRMQMHLVATMRLRSDFGGFTRHFDRSLGAHGREGGLNPAFELLHSYLSITNVARWIDLRIGRQLQMEPLDLFGFDGVWGQLRLPWGLRLELIGGLRNGGRWGVDAPIFLVDGTDVSETNQGWRPMVGVAAVLRRRSVDARLSYRTSWHVIDPDNPGAIYPTAAYGEMPAVSRSEEKLAAWGRVRLLDNRLQIFGGLRANLLTERVDEAQVGLAIRFAPSAQMYAEYVSDRPDFDGDSIFNIFNLAPYQEVRAVYEHRFGKRWRAYARGVVRLFGGGDEDAPQARERRAVDVDGGGGLGAAYLAPRLLVRADLYWQEGYGGRTLGLFAFARWRVLPRRLGLTARVTVAHWNDDLSVTPRGVNAGLALGGWLRITDLVAVHLVVEDNFGTYHRSDLRLFALVNVSWCSRGRCSARTMGVP